MTCMVPLPDGTYMIMNGAQQGVAGFGLATEPNLQALLYDPSQPVNSRISILNTTIVDRLYHSEAVLLNDGRVIVSGSDPEDTRFPQEYRIEVYTPPYLSTGLTQPEFNITNTDWSYNEQVQITVKLFQGTTDTMRVSLIGGMSFELLAVILHSVLNVCFLQLSLALTETALVLVRSSRSSLALATLAPSPRRPTHTSALQRGSKSSSSMVLLLPTLTGSALVVTLVNLVC